MGSGSIHADLLDHLASQFIHQEWSIKSLIRYIMTSKTYQMSSSIHSPQNHVKDPDNQWFWRQEIRRLDAEAIRDSLLDLSGDLNRKTGGPSVYPELPRRCITLRIACAKDGGKAPRANRIEEAFMCMQSGHYPCRSSKYLMHPTVLSLSVDAQ